MKKIICFALILVCIFSLASCALINKITGKDKNDDGAVAKTDVEKISDIVNSSSPTKIATMIQYVGSDTLKASYDTLIDRTSGNIQIDFEYQRYAKVEEMLPGNIKTVTGKVLFDAEGNVSDDDGATWTPEEINGYLPNYLNIDEARFSSYELTDDGKDLRAEIDATEARRVFGTDVSAEGKIVIEIDTNGQYLYSVKITYTAKDTGATVIVQNSYDYSPVTIG